MLAVIVTLVPVFALMLVGMVMERLQLLPRGAAAVLNQFVFNVGMPALIFVSVGTKSPEDISSFAYMGGSFLGVVLTFLLVYMVYSFFFRRSYAESGALALLASFPNTAFLGLPIMVVLFPHNDTAVLASTMSTVLCLPALMFVTMQLEFDRHGRKVTLQNAVPAHPENPEDLLEHSIQNAEAQEVQPRAQLVLIREVCCSLLKNPILIATFAGVLLCLLRIPIPVWVESVFRTLGSTTTPCALVALGMVLAVQLSSGAGKMHGFMNQLPINLAKIVVQPALTFILLSLFGVDGTWRAMGVLLSAMPTGTIAYVLCENYEIRPRDASQVIITNTLFSCVSIPFTAIVLDFFACL